MNEDVLLPLALFSMIVAITWLIYFYGNKKRTVAHKTIRLAIEQGQQISPAMIEKMSDIIDPKLRDMRKSVILLSLSVALVVIAFVVPIDDMDGIRGVLAGAVIPGTLGLAYFGLWRFGHDSASD